MSTWYRGAKFQIEENEYSEEQEQKIARIIRLATIEINKSKTIPANKKLRILSWYAANALFGKWLPDSQQKLLSYIEDKSRKRIELISGEEILDTAKRLQNKWLEFIQDGVITEYTKLFKTELDNARMIMRQRELEGKKHYHNSFGNFEPFTTPVTIEGEGDYYYPENLYQSAKTKDIKTRQQFTGRDNVPAEAKKFGEQLSLRSDWDNIKINVMSWIQKKRLEGHDQRLESWLSTSPPLIVNWNNQNDRTWGIDIKSGEGLNLLGIILMLYRDRIRGEDIIGKWLKE